MPTQISDLHAVSNNAQLIQKIYDILQRTIGTCCRNKNGPVLVGLPGDSLVDKLMDVLPSLNDSYQERCQFLFTDECRVSFDHPQSVYGQYAKTILPRLMPAVSKDQFTCINPYLKSEDCARDYEWKLRELVEGTMEWPQLDVVMVDLGKHANVSSLFPDHNTQDSGRWVVAVNTLSEQFDRISLTMPVVNKARNIIFVATGSSKANVVKAFMEISDPKDTSALRPLNSANRVHWIVDKAVVTSLTKENTENNRMNL